MGGVERRAALRRTLPSLSRQAMQEQQWLAVALSALAVGEPDARRRRPSFVHVCIMSRPPGCGVPTASLLRAGRSNRIRMSSRPYPPTSCTPRGRPSSGHPRGNEMAGWPVTLIGRVNALPRPGHVRAEVLAERRRRPGRRRRHEDVVVVAPLECAGAHPLHACRSPPAVPVPRSALPSHAPSTTTAVRGRPHRVGARSGRSHAAASAAALAPIARRAASHSSSLDSSAGAATST